MLIESSGLHFIESHARVVRNIYPLEELIKAGKSRYQSYHVVRIPKIGKALFLDGSMQSAAIDEHIYHEALCHPALVLHPNPRSVAIAGGGEGATLREVLKHNSVERVDMVEIDGEIVEIAKELLPEWHQGAFDNKRTHLVISDARTWVEEAKEGSIDVFISDISEPYEGGPEARVFTREYFEAIRSALSEDGILAIQAGPASLANSRLFETCFQTLSEIFPLVRGYATHITSFFNTWGFILASKNFDPLDISVAEIVSRLNERGVISEFYRARIHRALFTLPEPILERLEKRDDRVISTDRSPVVW